jgi:hypothetical protein
MKITYIEALMAMDLFLDKYYQRTKNDDLGLLLSDISISTFLGGGTADPAAWEDWEEAINLIKSDKKRFFLTTQEAFEVMIVFLRSFGERISSHEIKSLLSEILVKNDGFVPKQPIINFWLECLKKIKENNGKN